MCLPAKFGILQSEITTIEVATMKLAYCFSFSIFVLTLSVSPGVFGQDNYESANDSADQVLWRDVVWQDPFDANPSANNTTGDPGSLFNGSGATDDNVTLGYHIGSGTHDYRIQGTGAAKSENIGEIGSLNIGSANNTSSGAIQLQVRLGGALKVNGDTTLGFGSNQGSILLNSQAGSVNLRGNVEVAGTATNHFISIASSNANAELIIGGDINGFEKIDLRINRTGDVIYDTTDDGVTDTGVQNFNLDNFDLVANTATNGLVVNHTAGRGKTFNVDDVDIARNSSSSVSTNTLEGILNIRGSEWTVDNNLRAGTTATNSGSGSQARIGKGTVNVGQDGDGFGAGKKVEVGNFLWLGGGPDTVTGSGTFGEGIMNIEDDYEVTVGSFAYLGRTTQSRGELNVNNGVLKIDRAIHIGGDESNGDDAGSSGLFTVGASGTATIGDGVSGGSGTTAGDNNIFLGRDGEGTMTVAGVATVTQGNIQVGNSSIAGNVFNGVTAGTGTLNVLNGGTVNVLDDGDATSGFLNLGITANATATANIDGVLNIAKAINVGSDGANGSDLGATGTMNVTANGVVTIGNGNQNSNWNIGRDGLGEVTVDGGSVTVTQGEMLFGNSSVATGQANKLDINNGGSVVVADGQIRVGETANNEGTINVNNGTLNVSEEVYLGGGSTNGSDDGATGTLTIGSGGTLIASDDADTGGDNVEVGRDAAGFLTVDGGTLNLGSGNLVVGQFSSSGSSNNSRGTIVFSGAADVNIGDSTYDGTNDDGRNSDFNFNKGGGDVAQSGSSTVDVENNFNMQDANGDSTNGSSSYTISDTASFTVGNNFSARNNSQGTNSFAIVGGGTNVNVGGNFGGSASFDLGFDFLDTATITDFGFDVTGAFNVNGSEMVFSGLGGLASYYGDIELVNIGGSRTGLFSNFADGDKLAGTAYQFSYSFGDGNDIGLIQAVPEPGALAFLGICVVGLATRRRRLV